MPDAIYNIGDKFGKWIITGDPRWERSQFSYPVKCECGRTGWRTQSLLKTERTKSCNSCSLRQRKIDGNLKSVVNRI
jgi:hypothetical protein